MRIILTTAPAIAHLLSQGGEGLQISTESELPGPGKVGVAPEGKPLAEAAWQAWLRKGRAQEERDSAVRMTSVKWLAIAALLASGVLFWGGRSFDGLVVMFIVAAAAIAVMKRAMHDRKYGLAILFGALAVVYNPVLPLFSFSGDWQRGFVLATVVPFMVSLAWRNSKVASRSALTAMLVLAAASAATPADLSRYRSFQLGADLTTVSAQTGQKATQAKLISARPARIQELEWSPQSGGAYSETEAAKTVLFSFYNDQLYRITVDYDRYKTEGLTADDIIEAVSAANGTTASHPVADKGAPDGYSVPQEVLARWEDSQYRVDLFRAPYGTTFRLVATVKRLESPVQASLLEAKRLDDQEAPQREAARAAEEAQSEQARLERLRAVNKPKFRP